jgi:WhiB family redox-sensing transcriptional regulator
VPDSNFPCGHTRNEENVNLVKRLGRADVRVCKTCNNERRMRNHYRSDKETRRQGAARRRAQKRKEAGLDVPVFRMPGEWALEGICRKSAEPDMWFTETAGHALSATQKQAIEACGWCPVRAECLQFALDTDEQFGVWGGMTPSQRRKLKNRGNGDGA